MTEQSAFTFSYFTDLTSAAMRTNNQKRLCINAEPFIMPSDERSAHQPVVSGKGIYPLLVPIPPLDEQKCIVTKLNDCVSIIDVLESDKSDLQTTIQLTKSKILDLAIRGKIVPQNPDDEPASVLLEPYQSRETDMGNGSRRASQGVALCGEWACRQTPFTVV